MKQENIYLAQKQVVMQKYFNDRHVDIGFSRKLNVFVWSCVKRLGTSGFKFPAKGSLPVILSSSMVWTRSVLSSQAIADFNFARNKICYCLAAKHATDSTKIKNCAISFAIALRTP